jgi:hypothetical protein
MDSTPDLSKTDQMTIVLRYCTPTSVNERLVKLCPFDNHKGQSLYFILENYLKSVGLNIEDYRASLTTMLLIWAASMKVYKVLWKIKVI